MAENLTDNELMNPQTPEERAKQKKKAAKPGDELVEYTAPLLGDPSRADIIVVVNGEDIRIRRGETVKIKRKHYEVLQHAAEQENRAYRARLRAQRQADRPIAEL